VTFLVAGCGTVTHNEAVRAVRQYANLHGVPGAVRCSSGIGGQLTRTPDYYCIVGRGSSCDEFHAQRRAKVWSVSLYRRNVDCVLPA
jgi:hypothetical protein